jgi:hypothetical protein
MRFTPIDVPCQHCGTNMHITHKRDATKKFCSPTCYHAYEAEHGGHGVVEAVTFHCKRCGKPFTRKPGSLRQYRKTFGRDPLYCSRACGWIGKRKTEGRPCIVCGKPVPTVWVARSGRTPRTEGRRNTICSPECRSAFKVAELARLKPIDSRQITKRVERRTGYIRLHIPRTPDRKGYDILEHRYVMEQMLGRPLTSEETVHHVNGQRTDNRPTNLSLRSGRHGPGGDVPGMIRWAHEFIARYPQFDAEGNFHPVNAGEVVDH